MLINKDHLLHQLDGRPEDGWISIKAVRAMIEAEEEKEEQKDVPERNVGEWDMFDLITSAYYGKMMYSKQDNGIVYSRYSCKFMSVDESIREFLAVIREDIE